MIVHASFELSVECVCCILLVACQVVKIIIKSLADICSPLVTFLIFSVRSLTVIRTAINNVSISENVLQ